MAGNIAEYIIRLVSDIRGGDVFIAKTGEIKNSLDKAKLSAVQMGDVLGTKMVQRTNKAGETTTSLSTKYQTLGKNVGQTTVALDKEGNVISTTNSVMTTAGKSTKNLAQNMWDLTRRAMMTIPVWLVLRSVLMLVMDTIKEGVDYVISFDKAMVRARAVIHDTTMSNAEVVAYLTKEIKELSNKTGISMAKLTDTFYRFGTVGLSVKDSVEGMNASVKLAKATMGDVDSIAETMALTFKLMGDKIEITSDAFSKQDIIGAKIYKLYQTNAFTIDQFRESLAKFLPTANTMNLSLEETIALLATMNTSAIQAGRGGTILRTTFMKLVQNLDQITSSLGIFTTGTESRFDVIVAVIEKINKLIKEGGLGQVKAEQLFKEFGGVRGSEAVRALSASFEVLAKNIKDAKAEGKDLDQVMADYFKRNEEVNDSIQNQVEIFKNLKKRMGQVFIEGITGADDWRKGLKKTNEELERMIPLVEGLGKVLNKTAKKSMEIYGWKEIMKAIAFFSSGGASTNFVIPEVITGPEAPQIASNEPKGEYTGAGRVLGPGIPEMNEVNKLKKEYIKKLEEENKLSEMIDKKVALKLRLLEEETKYSKMSLEGYNDAEVANSKLVDRIKELVSLHNKMTYVNGESVTQINEQEILSLAISKDWEKINQLLQLSDNNYQDLLDLAKRVRDVEAERLKIMQQYSDTLKSTIEESFVSLMKGEKNLANIFKNLGDTVVDNVMKAQAKAVTALIFQKTGIGEMFGGTLAGIENMFKSKGEQMADYHGSVILTQGKRMADYHGDVISKAVSSALGGEKAGGAGILDTYASGGSLLANLLNSDVKKETTGILKSVKEAFTTKLDFGSIGDIFTNEKMTGKNSKLSAGVTSAMAGMELASLYKLKGTGNVMGGAMSGAMAGMTLGGPIGAVLGGLYGAIRGGQSKTTEEIQNQTFQVSSRLEVSNKQLQMVNRNLVALRSELTFILKPSSYFSEKSGGLEDEFSLASKMGVM